MKNADVKEAIERAPGVWEWRGRSALNGLRYTVRFSRVVAQPRSMIPKMTEVWMLKRRRSQL